MMPAPFSRECRDGAAGRCGKLRRMHESRLLRYGVAVALAVLAGFLTINRGIMLETPFFLFLGAVILSAIYGGVGPAFVTIVISMLLMRGIFPPELARYMGETHERLQKLGGFVLVALMSGSLVAALRRERNLLRESEDFYRAIAENSRDAVMLVNNEREIVWANRAAEHTFAEGSRLTGKPISIVLPNEGWAAELSAVNCCEALDEDNVKQITVATGPGGPVAVELSFRGLRREGEDVLAIMARDVTRYIYPRQAHTRGAALPA
jgi:PAS domain S-box-containing protein